jgi:hypothetical protein
MSAGLPATGVGGALYLLLIVWMVLRELTRPTNGNHSVPSRWPFIGTMVAISIVMVVVLLGERFLIHGALKLAVVYARDGKIRNAPYGFIPTSNGCNALYSACDANGMLAWFAALSAPSTLGDSQAAVRPTSKSRTRRGNPVRSYAPDLSRGMPGDEESDP